MSSVFGTYVFIQSTSGLVLDIPSGYAGSGVILSQKKQGNDNATQLWKFTADGFLEHAKGVVIEIENNGGPGARIIANTKRPDSPAQMWRYDHSSEGILSSHRNLALDGGNISQGAQVIAWDHHRGTNQRWTLVSLSGQPLFPPQPSSPQQPAYSPQLPYPQQPPYPSQPSYPPQSSPSPSYLQPSYAPSAQPPYSPSAQPPYSPSAQPPYSGSTYSGSSYQPSAGYNPSPASGYAPSSGLVPTNKYSPVSGGAYSPALAYPPQPATGYVPAGAYPPQNAPPSAAYTPTSAYSPQPTTGYAPAAYPPQPATGYQPAPGYPQPAPGYPQPATGYPQPAPGYPQPATGYPQPAAGYPQSVSGYPQPTPPAYSPQPATLYPAAPASYGPPTPAPGNTPQAYIPTTPVYPSSSVSPCYPHRDLGNGRQGRGQFIVSRHSGLVLDVRDNGKRPGAHVIMWEKKRQNNGNQLWTFTQDGFIENVDTGLVLGIEGRRGGGKIITEPKRSLADATHQRWRYDPSGEIFTSYDNDLVLDVEGANSKGNHAIGFQYRQHNLNQKFFFSS